MQELFNKPFDLYSEELLLGVTFVKTDICEQ